jgi:hypothetical protein
MREYSSKIKLPLPLYNLVSAIENCLNPRCIHQVQNPNIIQRLSHLIYSPNYQAYAFFVKNVHTVTVPRLWTNSRGLHNLPALNNILVFVILLIFVDSKQENIRVNFAVSEFASITNDSIEG